MGIFVSFVRPAEYKDIVLFVNRTEDFAKLEGALHAHLDAESEGGLKLLVQGPRGVGKSLFTRHVIRHVRETGYDGLYVEIDGAIHTGAEMLLREICYQLGKELVENVTKSELKQLGHLLLKVASLDQRTIKEARSIVRSLTTKVVATGKAWDLVQLELGGSITQQSSSSSEESYTLRVDTLLLRRLLTAAFQDLAQHKQKSIIFLDNLDQIGYATREEDVTQITTLTKELLALDPTVLLINLREEFCSADIARHWNVPFPLTWLEPEALQKIYSRRLERASERERKAIEALPALKGIVHKLSQMTGSPYCFLLWLDALLRDSTLEETTVRADLLRWARARFNNVLSTQELTTLAGAFRRTEQGIERLTLDQLSSSPTPLRDAQLKRAVEGRLLVPDQLLSTECYSLAPELTFLVDS